MASVVLCRLSLLYYGSHCRIQDASASLRWLCLMLAIIMLFIVQYHWWSLSTNLMASIWSWNSVFYYRVSCRNLVFSVPPFIMEHGYQYNLCLGTWWSSYLLFSLTSYGFIASPLFMILLYVRVFSEKKSSNLSVRFCLSIDCWVCWPQLITCIHYDRVHLSLFNNNLSCYHWDSELLLIYAFVWFSRASRLLYIGG